jgi:hypothetical protein
VVGLLLNLDGKNGFSENSLVARPTRAAFSFPKVVSHLPLITEVLSSIGLLDGISWISLQLAATCN